MRNLVILMVLATLSSSYSAISQASLVGDTIDAGMYSYIDVDSHDYEAPRVLGYGLDDPFIVASGNSDQKQYSDTFLLDVEANSFHIDFIGECPTTSTCGFTSDFRIFDLDFGDGIKGVSVDTNAGTWSGLGWNDNLLSVTDNSVILKFRGITWDSDTYFNVTLSTVPIPSALWLFGSGLLGLIGVARRKKA